MSQMKGEEEFTKCNVVQWLKSYEQLESVVLCYNLVAFA